MVRELKFELDSCPLSKEVISRVEIGGENLVFKKGSERERVDNARNLFVELPFFEL